MKLTFMVATRCQYQQGVGHISWRVDPTQEVASCPQKKNMGQTDQTGNDIIPPVDRQTGVKTLSFPHLRWQAVIMPRKKWTEH